MNSARILEGIAFFDERKTFWQTLIDGKLRRKEKIRARFNLTDTLPYPGHYQIRHEPVQRRMTAPL